MKRLISVAVVALLLGAGVWGYLYAQGRQSSPKYRLAPVERGPLTAAVSATGNLNAVITVQVGSQVSGQIKELHADFNTRVRRDQVIARLDPSIFEAKVNQARAEVDSARATVLNQQAQLERARSEVQNARAAQAEGRAQTAKTQVALVDAGRDLERKTELFQRQLIAKSDFDTSQANRDAAAAQLDSVRAKEQALAAGVDSAAAQLRVAEAMLTSARAQVKQREAALRQAQLDLEHTTIRAPVDGVVVSRAVDVGQTVAASLQAPTLFTIAQDLTKMQVEASVDEADIGRIKIDDRATFTVDAFSGQTFSGTVTQIRKAPLIVQNVVTYTVVIAVANPGERLLPGMTANVKLVYAEKPSVLKVPNAALRFRPAGVEAGPPAAGRGAPGAGPAAGGAAARERLVTGLGLDAAQQKKLDAILQEARERQQPREATQARIREILSPEQRAKYDALAARAPGGGTPGRVFVLDAEGKPRAVPLVLGISDGTATEILRGELAEGQEIIAGLAGAGQSGRGTTGGPRLRL
jgi:HlyD family secretion protein